MSDNASVVAYLRHQSGAVSHVLCCMAAEVVLWTKRHPVSLMARYIPRKKNVLADQFSHPDQVLPSEWSLLMRVFKGICKVFGCPHLDLFATHANAKLPLYVSPVPDPMAWKQCTFQRPWDHLSAYALPRFALLRQVLSRVLSTGLSLVPVALLWPQKVWVTDLLSLLVGEPLELLLVWNLLVQLHVWKCHRGLRTFLLHTWKLSSVLSERQSFLRRLCESQLRTSGASMLPCTSPSGLGSSAGVIKGVSIPARHMSLAIKRKELSFSLPGTRLVCPCSEGLSGQP